jgi:hypothetical protein
MVGDGASRPAKESEMTVHKLKPAEKPVVVSIQLRLPMDVLDAIRKVASDNMRSINNEIIWRVQQTLKGEKNG